MPTMLTGTVARYNPDRRFGFIQPSNRHERQVFFHITDMTWGNLPSVIIRSLTQPLPKPNDRVRYEVVFEDANRPRAKTWEFENIMERAGSLDEAQQQLMRRVLGDNAEQCLVWCADPEWDVSRQHYMAYSELSGLSKPGTFNQVLLWLRIRLGECGITEPRLVRWPDMPRYSVRRRMASGKWQSIDLPLYTQAQADARAKEELRSLVVANLWPDAPPLSVGEALKVLVRCHRDVLKDLAVGDSEVDWFEERGSYSIGRRPTRHCVATGHFGSEHSWVSMDGHTYKDDEAKQLEQCGIAHISLNQ